MTKLLTGSNLKLSIDGSLLVYIDAITTAPKCSCPWYYKNSTLDGDARGRLFSLVHKLLHTTPY